MNTPIYVKIVNPEVEQRLENIKESLKQIQENACFISCKEPHLCVLPEPDNDCLVVENLFVYGVSALGEAKTAALKDFLNGLLSK